MRRQLIRHILFLLRPIYNIISHGGVGRTCIEWVTHVIVLGGGKDVESAASSYSCRGNNISFAYARPKLCQDSVSSKLANDKDDSKARQAARLVKAGQSPLQPPSYPLHTYIPTPAIGLVAEKFPRILQHTFRSVSGVAENFNKILWLRPYTKHDILRAASVSMYGRGSRSLGYYYCYHRSSGSAAYIIICTSLYPHSLGNWFINVLSVEHSASAPAPAPVAVPAGAHLLRSRFVVAVLKDMLSIWGSHIVCRRKREKATD